MILKKIVSGGQSGVDRAALDVAMAAGIPIGGWCPEGRGAEDGVIAPHYPLIEAHSPAPEVRTKLNVADSDGTLVLYERSLSGGTKLTTEYAKELNKPLMIIALDQSYSIDSVVTWIHQQQINVLNVAGPRISKCPQIYDHAYQFLQKLLKVLATSDDE